MIIFAVSDYIDIINSVEDLTKRFGYTSSNGRFGNVISNTLINKHGVTSSSYTWNFGISVVGQVMNVSADLTNYARAIPIVEIE